MLRVKYESLTSECEITFVTKIYSKKHSTVNNDQFPLTPKCNKLSYHMIHFPNRFLCYNLPF
jgi:hypothetical protein